LSGDVQLLDAKPAAEPQFAPASADGERMTRLEEEIASLRKDLADLRQQFAQFRKGFE
jgi:uncharacterized protein YceH (UPF0502 family)